MQSVPGPAPTTTVERPLNATRSARRTMASSTTTMHALYKGGSTGNLLLLLSSTQPEARSSAHAAPPQAAAAAAAASARARDGWHRVASQPNMLHMHPVDHGIDVRHVRADDPILALHETSSTESLDALGIVDDTFPSPSSHNPLPLAPALHEGSNGGNEEAVAADWTAAAAAVSRAHSSAPHRLEDLPDDLLRAILLSLDSSHRQAASSTCERLLCLAQSSFHTIALALPSTPLAISPGSGGDSGAAAAAAAPASLRHHLAALPAERFDTITRLELALPEVTDRRQARYIEQPCHPLNSWLASYLTTGHAGAALTSLYIRPLALPHPAAAAQITSAAATAHAPARRLSRHNSNGATHDVAPGHSCVGGSGSVRCSASHEVQDGHDGNPEGWGYEDEDDCDGGGDISVSEKHGSQPHESHTAGSGGVCVRSYTARLKQRVAHGMSEDAVPAFTAPTAAAAAAVGGSMSSLSPRERGAFVSGRALTLLATHCPCLRHLSLPLLAPSAAEALPSLSPLLTSLHLSVQVST